MKKTNTSMYLRERIELEGTRCQWNWAEVSCCRTQTTDILPSPVSWRRAGDVLPPHVGQRSSGTILRKKKYIFWFCAERNCKHRVRMSPWDVYCLPRYLCSGCGRQSAKFLQILENYPFLLIHMGWMVQSEEILNISRETVRSWRKFRKHK